ncbi:MAG: SHD1 domain-containing protein [Pirellulales bacterium]
MRRWFHCLLIGVLTCSLSVDTARACWYLRRGHGPCGCWQPACPPVATWPACHEVVIRDSACCGGAAYGTVVIVDGWRGDVCWEGTSHVVVGEVVADIAEPIVVAESTVTPSEPAPSREPTPAVAEPSAEPTPAPQEGIAAVAPAVPELKPAVDAAPAVERVAALEPAPTESVAEAKPSEPAAEPAPATPPPATEPEVAVAAPIVPAPVAAAPEPAPVVTAVEPPAPRGEPNIFEEVEAAADAAILDPAGTEPAPEPAVAPSASAAAPSSDALFAEPAAKPEPAVEPLAAPVASESSAAADESAADPAAEPAADDAPAPAADEPAGKPAADEPDPFSDASREPVRRWVDDTGSYATVGTLVDVRADGVEIRKANGRTVIVPLDRLSEHDRGYAAAAEARLAAERTPPTRDTAGL